MVTISINANNVPIFTVEQKEFFLAQTHLNQCLLVHVCISCTATVMFETLLMSLAKILDSKIFEFSGVLYD